MYTVRLAILMSLLIGTLSWAGCGGRPPSSAPATTQVPITVEPGERATTYDASQAIRSYASRVLGVTVRVKSAGGRAGTITLPAEAQESVNAAVKVAGATLTTQGSSPTDYTLVTADGLSLSLSADGRVTGLQIDGQGLVSAPAPALLLRDLSAAGQVTAPNLATNPGFEEGLASWTQLTNSGLDVSVVVSPTHSGDASLQFASTGESPAFAAGAGSPAPVVPGQRYRISAWWRSATGYVASPGGPPILWQMTLWRTLSRANGLYVLWLDANSQPLGDAELAVPLHLNAANWRLIRRELTAPTGAAYARPIVAAKLQAEETLWIDDVAFVPSPEPDLAVSGSVAPCATGASTAGATCLVQTATLTNGLSLTVTYTAHVDHIAIHGEVRDLDGRDRALDVSWGAPVDLSPHPRRLRRHPLPPLLQGEGGGGQGEGGEVWWDDAHTSRPITDTTTYANAISATYDGWLPMSLYPYSGVQIASKGVALGLPLDHPQLGLLAYDGASGRYGATYHLGISPQAGKVGPRATFDLLLYRFDPARGFRDVIARHRLLQPEAYAMTRPLYNYADAEQGLFFTERGVQKALAHDAANIYSAQYTLGELPLKLASSSDPRPTLDQALVAVADTLDSPNPTDAAKASAIINSAVVDPNGDWSLKHIGVYAWAPDWWEVSWAANLDPDLDEGLASWIMDWRVTPAFTATTEAGAHLDGVQIDNFMSTPTLDLRPASLAVADWPLVYSPHTYQPAVHNGFSHHEYLAYLRDYLDTEWGTERGISINFWGLGNPNYLAEFIDAFGGEGNNLRGNGEGENWNPEILDYRRAIAYGRPYHFANQTDDLSAAEAYTFTQMALLYGVRPGRGPNASQWEPEIEQMITDTVELVTRYWAAGWEPLTYAQADSEDVWIERFGHLSPLPPLLPGEGEGGQGGGGEVFFPVHNRTDFTRTATITIEAAPLGITYPTSVEVTDLVTEQPVPFSVDEGNIVVSPDLGPRETRVLQVSGGTTPPVSECVGDANRNGIGDVVDIQATASDLPCHIYLPLVAAQWRQPWQPSNGIVLADGPGGLKLVSAPATLPITAGHVAYLRVEVQGYHRPIRVTAQTLIHTYVNDITPAEPGDSLSFTVITVQGTQAELKLQTLRMRPHPLGLTFAAGRDLVNVPLTLEPAIQPRAPLFGTHVPPYFDYLPQPFLQVWGPNCRGCRHTDGDPDGSTRDIACAKRLNDTCNCHPIQLVSDPDPATEANGSRMSRQAGIAPSLRYTATPPTKSPAQKAAISLVGSIRWLCDKLC